MLWQCLLSTKPGVQRRKQKPLLPKRLGRHPRQVLPEGSSLRLGLLWATQQVLQPGPRAVLSDRDAPPRTCAMLRHNLLSEELVLRRREQKSLLPEWLD